METPESTSAASSPTARTTVRRRRERAVYELAEIHRILDDGLFCHVGFAVEGQPFVIPTVYGRSRDVLLLHGSPASRMLRVLENGVEACVTVTLVEGLVLARSAFHHSINYRSVVLFGTATEVTDPAYKLEAMRVIVEHVAPGRWTEVRPPSETEIRQTSVLRLPITEASAKVRKGPPLDAEEDYALAVWAGELPLRVQALAPVADSRLAPGTAVPPSVKRLARTGR